VPPWADDSGCRLIDHRDMSTPGAGSPLRARCSARGCERFARWWMRSKRHVSAQGLSSAPPRSAATRVCARPRRRRVRAATPHGGSDHSGPRHGRLRGPLNLTSPAPVRNQEFADALARAVARRLRPPVPGRLVHLKFEKLPVRALQLGYGFRYPEIDAALADLVATVRRRTGACDPGSNAEQSRTRAG
jgi:hypothetical protein